MANIPKLLGVGGGSYLHVNLMCFNLLIFYITVCQLLSHKMEYLIQLVHFLLWFSPFFNITENLSSTSW